MRSWRSNGCNFTYSIPGIGGIGSRIANKCTLSKWLCQQNRPEKLLLSFAKYSHIMALQSQKPKAGALLHQPFS
jgi:hypothetical protein